MGNASNTSDKTPIVAVEPDHLRAVIDIGSNSVRLVVFNGPARCPLPILNEKALCGLGRGLGPNGNLNKEAVDNALRVLRRFRQLLDLHDNPPTRVIATAAVREASDGPDFLDKVRSFGFEVALLSGEEEGYYAALGVVAFRPGASGIVGDMGGGSLELSRIKNGVVRSTGSLSIGPFQLMRQADDDMQAAEKIARKAIKSAEWLGEHKTQIFFAVGGAWRTIARMHMALREYPVPVLHHYTMSKTEAFDICELIEHQSRESLQAMRGISRRRLETVPYAAMVLKRLLTDIDIKQVVVSTAGVREGVLFDDLDENSRAMDPLPTFGRYMAYRLMPAAQIGDAVFSMIDPLFADEPKSYTRLRHMVCLLMDISAYAHPEQRGRQGFEHAMSLPIIGLSHKERIIAGLSLYRRYQGRRAEPPDAAAVRLLDEDDIAYATRLGLALRFSADFMPKLSGPQQKCQFSIKNEKLVFSIANSMEDLFGELPEKRLASLASFMELTPALRFHKD